MKGSNRASPYKKGIAPDGTDGTDGTERQNTAFFITSMGQVDRTDGTQQFS